jgi:hypothetical protein
MRPRRYRLPFVVSCIRGLLWVLTYWDETRLRRRYPTA